MPAFDLQSHSLHSDGALAPAEVVARAAAAGIELLALTDHDTVDGVEEALEAGRRHGVQVVTGTELSSLDPDGEDLHILGYGIDHRDPALLATLEAYRADRATRADRMVAALREAGLALDEAPLAARRASGKPIGRPHLAEAVHAHPANRERLADEGIDGSLGDVLVAYLLPGTPGYRGRTTPTVAEAIATIHAAGGVAVWAHPFWDIEIPATVLATIDRFAALGLDGVECFYATHTAEQTLLLADACDERGLLTTGSADFHAPDHALFSRFGAFSLHGRTPALGPIADAGR